MIDSKILCRMLASAAIMVMSSANTDISALEQCNDNVTSCLLSPTCIGCFPASDSCTAMLDADIIDCERISECCDDVFNTSLCLDNDIVVDLVTCVTAVSGCSLDVSCIDTESPTPVTTASPTSVKDLDGSDSESDRATGILSPSRWWHVGVLVLAAVVGTAAV